MRKTLKIRNGKVLMSLEAYKKRQYKAIEKFHKAQAKIPFEQKIDDLGSMCDIADAMRKARLNKKI